MKIMLLCLLLAFPFVTAHAQNNDSLAYQLQRAKINGLLAQRSQKFNQYSSSLSTHTGIFGWQTKKDIKRSGEILMDIAQTDNVIFRELKILLDYKTFQQTQVAAQSHESEDLSMNYMKTINKLRDQNEQLLKQQALADKAFHQKQTFHMVLILLLIVAVIFLFYRNKTIVKA